MKLHLPVDSFVACAQAKKPENTLFMDINSFEVTLSDLETYLPLIIGVFEASPQGVSTNKQTWHINHLAKGTSRGHTLKTSSSTWTVKAVTTCPRANSKRTGRAGLQTQLDFYITLCFL